MNLNSIIIFLTLLGLLLTTACTKDIGVRSEVESISYLALGDSYTIGQGVETKNRWPIQLAGKLRSHNHDISSTKIIAQTGWTTSNLLAAIDSENLDNFNLVSLLIGVNNQFQGKPFSLFENEFETLLEKSISLAGDYNKVFVVSIPDYGVTPFGSANSAMIAMELDRYNDHMMRRCLIMGIPFIDITEVSRDLGASNGALASDNLHPSGMQYAAWVELILPVVVELLNE